MSPSELPRRSDADEWAVFGMPVFISDQLDPGVMLAVSMIYEPTEEESNRFRISAVRVTGIGEQHDAPKKDPNDG